jgi:hypothetical protein
MPLDLTPACQALPTLPEAPAGASPARRHPRLPFAWTDDEITHADRAWASAHHHGQALPHRADPTRGIADDGLTAVAEWLRAI